jgi:threonine dehydrogenase-like Zn-dependent dehydrogenase
MKAVLLRDLGVLESADVPMPVMGEGMLRLRVLRCGLCRTDAKMWAQGQQDLIPPRILGHEVCAIRPDTGERVAVWPGEACGKCAYCLGMAENLCSNLRIMGFNRDGGLAEWMAAPESSLTPVPPTLGNAVVCLAEPLACALNALDLCGASEGERIAVFGGGPVGLLVALAARALGAFPFVVEIDSERLDASEAFRARLGVDAASLVDSRTFDVAINACASEEAFLTGLARLKSGGRFCLFSGFRSDARFSAAALNEIHYRQLRAVGAYGCAKNQISRALGILEKYQSSAKLLIEKEIPIEQTEAALKQILEGKAFKIVVNLEN